MSWQFSVQPGAKIEHSLLNYRPFSVPFSGIDCVECCPYGGIIIIIIFGYLPDQARVVSWQTQDEN